MEPKEIAIISTYSLGTNESQDKTPVTIIRWEDEHED